MGVGVNQLKIRSGVHSFRVSTIALSHLLADLISTSGWGSNGLWVVNFAKTTYLSSGTSTDF